MNMAQWESSCLPVQEVRIRFLVREDLTSCRAIKPPHSPLSPRSGALGCNKRSHCSEKQAHRNWRGPHSLQPMRSRHTATGAVLTHHSQ